MLEQVWEKRWFKRHNNVPKEHWQSLQNQRQFMEQFARQRNLSKPSDWGNVTFRSVVDMGGTFIVHYYHCSVFKALVTLFPGNLSWISILFLIEISWKKEWFPNTLQFPISFWRKEDNRKHFLQTLASDYNIFHFHDWQRVSLSLIKKKGGQVRIFQYITSFSLCYISIKIR